MVMLMILCSSTKEVFLDIVVREVRNLENEIIVMRASI